MYRIVLMCITYVLCRIGYWRLFEEHGIAGWYTFIPFAGMYQYYKLTMKKGLLVIASYIPFINIVVSVWSRINLSKMYEHGRGFTVCLILFPAIFLNLVQYELVGDEEKENEKGKSQTTRIMKEEPAKAVLYKSEDLNAGSTKGVQKQETIGTRTIYRNKSNACDPEKREVHS